MEYMHRPVLLKQALEFLNIKAGGTYIDGTVGGGGHSAAILERLTEGGRLLGIDFDNAALEAASNRLSEVGSNAELVLVQGNFAEMESICMEAGINEVDGVLLDIGVSSYQLDNPERGFSYNQDGRLDMRMDTNSKLDAFTVVNSYDRERLARVIFKYGEEKWASRIAKFIVEEREKGKIETTGQLVNIIKAAIPASARRNGPHPAKRTFQAIRIEVNREIENLEKGLEGAIRLLRPGGRICVITFHSLEDRVVKNKFRDLSSPCACPSGTAVCNCGRKPVVRCVTKKPVTADETEKAENSRSRSAKLRVAEKEG
jgi:16S rRNA (cytosine1402-N4)-methyltransferase